MGGGREDEGKANISVRQEEKGAEVREQGGRREKRGGSKR